MIYCKACGFEGYVDGDDFNFTFEFTKDGIIPIGVITCGNCGRKLRFDVYSQIDFESVISHANIDDWEEE